MFKKQNWLLIMTLIAASTASQANAWGKKSVHSLIIAKKGKTEAIVVVSPTAGKEEARAAGDLVKYINLMSGATPQLANTPAAIAQAKKSRGPILFVGQAALDAKPSLKNDLKKLRPKRVILHYDAIVLRRDGNRVYLVGNNDSSHYYAVAELLRSWGCRWYLPTEFGECIPERNILEIGDLNIAYAPPFEIRTYWISWLGDYTGAHDFQLRNGMTLGRSGMPPTGHAIGKYVKGFAKSAFNIALTDPKTAEHIAEKVAPEFAAGKNFSLGMEDGSYSSSYPRDQKLMHLQWDKYFLRWSVTDPFLELYNNIARILQKKYPKSQAKIGFLAYANMTIPPVRKMKAEPCLYCELAPIDIDPIHGMDSIQSPPRQEYKTFLYKWAKIMDGRLAIYDYDQGMLVWRDIPDPSQQAFAQDVKHYRDAGILGINTESRNAIATTFLNLYFRGRLMWNPDADVPALLADFYPKFYGPAAKPMSEYWNTIFQAWADTIVTEHEFFVAPAIYTPAVLQVMNAKMKEAEALVAPLRKKAKLSRNEKLYLDRIAFTRMSCDITTLYLNMVRAAADDLNYSKAVALGEKALAIREKLTAMNGTFTTYKRMHVENRGYAWWPGEVRQYRELIPFVNGKKGKKVVDLPLEWAFHRDPQKTGIKDQLAGKPVDLTYWNAHKDQYDLDSRRNYPVDQWEMLRTDLYMQAQGVRMPDRQSYIGYGWYQTDIQIPAVQAKKKLHLRFPGLFNECRLYVNGKEVAHRKQNPIWWYNDYRFEWDVDLAGKLKPGKNTLTLLVDCEHHMGGMFRRPFIYALN